MTEREGGRARVLAEHAVALALGASVALPDDLQLWRLAGGRPDAGAGTRVGDPAGALCGALEGRLSAGERRRGAHYTPASLADELAVRALPDGAARTVCDPACGAGALLLAAARRIDADPSHIARDLLWGADLEPLAAAVTEAAIALWSGGVAPAPGHVVAADALLGGRRVWRDAPSTGFDAVIGNPPFQSQLAERTARSRAEADAMRAQFGAAASGPYVDTAALFLLAGVELAATGARVALVQPISVVAARDAAPVRAELASRAALLELWEVPGQPFDASVRVCVPVLEVGVTGDADWSATLATSEGVPLVPVDGYESVGDVAHIVASFRDEYYGLIDHVREGGEGAPLVTSGMLDVGRSRWGERPGRFAKQQWQRPVIDLTTLEAAGGRAWSHVEAVLRPKVVVATQTRVLEAVADRHGAWVPCTPVISVVPTDPSLVDRLAVAIASPVATAVAGQATAGTGLSAGAMRVSAAVVRALPLPDDDDAWAAAAASFARWSSSAATDPAWADEITAAYDLPADTAEAVLAWWRGRIRFAA